MLTVHHLRTSQSERIVWLCEELGVPYELVCYDRDPATRAGPPAYKALHPAGTAPIITDGDLVLPETGAIVEYVARRYGGGRLIPGPDDAGFADYLFWFHYANGSMMPAIMIDLVGKRFGADKHPAMAGQRSRGDVAFDLVERRLGEATWFAGEAFTLADIMMAFQLTTMRRFAPRDLSAMPNLRGYLQRVRARPAYRTAMEKADPAVLDQTD